MPGQSRDKPREKIASVFIVYWFFAPLRPSYAAAPPLNSITYVEASGRNSFLVHYIILMYSIASQEITLVKPLFTV